MSATEGPVDIAQLEGVKYLRFSSYHACVVHLDGSASCWGDNRYGQTGIGTETVGVVMEPRLIEGIP